MHVDPLSSEAGWTGGSHGSLPTTNSTGTSVTLHPGRASGSPYAVRTTGTLPPIGAVDTRRAGTTLLPVGTPLTCYPRRAR